MCTVAIPWMRQRRWRMRLCGRMARIDMPASVRFRSLWIQLPDELFMRERSHLQPVFGRMPVRRPMYPPSFLPQYFALCRSCAAGYRGDNCDTLCKEGTYGKGCENKCQCQNNAECSPFDGTCTCTGRWTGDYCDSEGQLKRSMSVCLSVSEFVCLSFRLSMSVFMSVCVCLSVCLSV